MLDERRARTLADRLRGDLILPEHADFDSARSIWNARLQARPTAIARCSGAADVQAAVQFAREQGVHPTVRSGGHSYAGQAVADGKLLIDLSRMNGIWIDPVARRAHAQAGATWGALDREAGAFDLATCGATVSSVGIGGVALGGGTGFLVRKLGLTIDNVVRVHLVTADGRMVCASADEHPDLFWGLRGGGGNLGIATSIEFLLHPVPPVLLCGEILFPEPQIPETLRFYRDFMEDAPDEIQCYAFLLRLPPIDIFPATHHNRVILDLVVCHAGPPERAEAALRPLRHFGQPFMDTVATRPYTALQQSFDAGLPKGQRYYSRGHYLKGLPDEAIDAMIAQSQGLGGGYSVMYLERLGGAAGRIPQDATAFPHRDAPYALHVLAGWTAESDDGAMMAWARDAHAAMAEFSTGGVYVNLLAEDEQDRVAAAYGSSYERLRQIKRQWDPENFFRSNANVSPAA